MSQWKALMSQWKALMSQWKALTSQWKAMMSLLVVRLIKAHRSDQSRTEHAERFVNDGQARTGPRTEAAHVHSYADVC